MVDCQCSHGRLTKGLFRPVSLSRRTAPTSSLAAISALLSAILLTEQRTLIALHTVHYDGKQLMTKNNFVRIRSFLGIDHLTASLDSRDMPLRRGIVQECAPIIVNIPSASAGISARNILHLLRPCNVVGGSLIRKGRMNDGGYIMLDHGLDTSIAYSLGIGDGRIVGSGYGIHRMSGVAVR